MIIAEPFKRLGFDKEEGISIREEIWSKRWMGVPQRFCYVIAFHGPKSHLSQVDFRHMSFQEYLAMLSMWLMAPNFAFQEYFDTDV